MRVEGGLRPVALFEASKGLLVLLAGFSLPSLVQDHAQQLTEQLVAHLHLNPAHHNPRVLAEAAIRVTDTHLWLLAAAALAYATLRFVEAWGLWHARRWAEWFAVAGAAVYVPFELWGLRAGPNALGLIALTVNLVIIVVVVRALRKRGAAAGVPAP